MTAALQFEARVLVAGEVEGVALCLEESLSFWGGFDPAEGTVIDVHHPQYGQKLGGKIVFIPSSRGSAGTPGGIAETLRNGSGPAALVLGEADVNIGVGAAVANRLYGMSVPVLQLPPGQMLEIRTGDGVSIDAGGVIRVSR